MVREISLVMGRSLLALLRCGKVKAASKLGKV